MMTAGKVLLACALLQGCAAKVQTVERKVYVMTPLSLPARPELPRMNSDALSCISDETKWALLNRDILLKNYIAELETTIKSTQWKNSLSF